MYSMVSFGDASDTFLVVTFFFDRLRLFHRRHQEEEV